MNSPQLWFDRLIDRTIVGSYTSLGYLIRRRAWDPADLDVDMTGKTCVVTGANSGLGFIVAEQLAGLGAKVHMVARSQARGEAAREKAVTHTGNQDIHLAVADLGSLVSVRNLCKRFLQTEERLDVLVNNAGVLLPERQISVDGIELSFATNVVGPFLLTNLLLPLMRPSSPARVITVSSGGMYTQRLDVDDLQFEHKPFNGTIAYAQAKRAQVILTEMWAERLTGSGVTANSMHPGWVRTPGLDKSLPAFSRFMRPFLRTPEQGADTIVWLAVATRLAERSGEFWFDRVQRDTHKSARTQSSTQERHRLWDECVRLSGLKE